MSLFTHRAERTDRLAAGLAELVASPSTHPFVAEVISVPTPGVERWLAQFLSHRLGTTGPGRADGVAAGFAFWSLPRLVGRALAHLIDPDDDPWSPPHLSWTLLAELDASAHEAWAAPVAAYLGLAGRAASSADHDVDHGADQGRYRQGRRWATARRLAGLFHRYGVQRPELVQHWLAGRDVDADGRPLPPDRAWQAELWRRARRTIGQPSGAERLAGACADLVARPDVVELPERLSIFGPTRLTREQLSVLGALAEHRDVHLWLPHPSPVLWDRVAALPHADSAARRDDPSAVAARHPLLAYLSRDSRELQQTLRTRLPETGETAPMADTAGQDQNPAPATLLGRLQAGLVADELLPATVLGASDHSIAVHAAHGPDRQIEVLRDVLVGLLADDPTLEPRDIVVMCPDIETFAPLVTAAFGLARPDGSDTADLLGADHPGHRLRVRLADRSLRQVNPLLGLVARLIDLAQSRVTASQVLDLCATDAVMRKFGLTDDDLDTVTDLVRTSGVRWGIDADHRQDYGLIGFPHNTWRMGLDRMLLGVTMDGSDGRFIGTTLPLDDVDSGAVDRIGRLVELFSRLTSVLDDLTGRHPIGHWLSVLSGAIDALAAVPPADQWQLAHAHVALVALAGTEEMTGSEEITDDPEPARSQITQGSDDPRRTVLLGLPDVRALLADTMRGRPTRANFRTGSLTMCTMMPMRSVPHRVVCLLGVDDGVFPRRSADDGDDLLTVDPWVGDRDPRSEDRQLLLDAVLAAEEQLVIVYSGADPRTNALRPPAAPIGALLDAVDATAVSSDGRRVREAITVRHLLQPFDPENFRDPVVSGTPRSFDRAALAGARAVVGDRERAHSPWLVGVLPPAPDPGPVSVEDLLRFYKHPVRAFLRARAGLYVRDDESDAADDIPIDPDGLGRWAIGDRLFRLVERGVPLDEAVAAEWRRGAVPPKSLGSAAIRQSRQQVERLLGTAQPHLDAEQQSVDVDLTLPHGRVTGTVSLRDGDLVTLGVSKARPKRQLEAWIQLLAVTAARPDRPITAHVLGPGDPVTLGPVPPGLAPVVLDDLLALYLEGLCEPLPFAANTCAEYVEAMEARLPRGTVIKNVQMSWKWDHDAAYGRFFGARAEDLVAPRPLPDGSTRPSRFMSVAPRVLRPLIGARG